MNANNLEIFLTKLTGNEVNVYSNQENVYISCPLAEYTHTNGEDNSRGFSVKVDPLGKSLCRCWNSECNFSGSLSYLCIKLSEFEPRARQLSRLCQRYEAYALDDIELFLDTPKQVKTTILCPSVLSEYEPIDFSWRGISLDTLKAFNVRVSKQRIILPVFDTKGQLVGLSGRARYDNIKPKYLNLKKFSKGNFLYGGWLTKHDTVIILEGQVDVMRVHDALGDKYSSVCVFGSSPTKTQIQLIKSNYKKCVLFPDNDPAGKVYASKLIERLGDMSCKLVTKIYGLDAGELSNEEIINAVETAIEVEKSYVI